MKRRVKNVLLLFVVVFSPVLRWSHAAAATAVVQAQSTALPPGPAKVASATKASSAAASVGPQDVPYGYEVIPTNLGPQSMVDIAVGGKEPLVVAVGTDGHLAKMNRDWRSWSDIDPARSAALNLGDGTVVAIRAANKNGHGKLLQYNAKTNTYAATGSNAKDKNCQFRVLRNRHWIGFACLANQSKDNPKGEVGAMQCPTPGSGEPQFVVREGSSDYFKQDRINNGSIWEHIQVGCKDQASLRGLTFFFDAAVSYASIDAEGKFLGGTRGKDGRTQALKMPDESSYFDIEVIDSKGAAKPPVWSYTSVSVGGDGTMWAVDNEGFAWRALPGQYWKRLYTWNGLNENDVVGFARISVGSKENVVVVDKNSYVHFKKSAPVEYPEDYNGWGGLWFTLPDKAVSAAAGGDGEIWCASTDEALYRLVRSDWGGQWQKIAHPADFNLGAPQFIRMKDKFNVVFIDYQNQVFSLSPGAAGSAQGDWVMIPENVTMTFASKGIDGTLVGIEVNGRTLVRKPTSDDTAALIKAPGNQLFYNQVMRLAASPASPMRSSAATGASEGFVLWTHAQSPFADDNVPEPNNFIELLAGSSDPNNDRRDTQGSFFTLTHEGNDQEKGPVMFGDVVKIWSLYSVAHYNGKKLVDTKRSGSRSREWLWWVRCPHFQWGNGQCNIAVSIMSHGAENGAKNRDIPATKEAPIGSERFRLVSPYGKTGPVGASDTVELLPLADSASGPLWLDPWSQYNDGTDEILCQSAAAPVDDWGTFNRPYGAREFGGYQLFSITPINGLGDLLDSKDCSPSATTIYNMIAGHGQFTVDSNAQQAPKKDVPHVDTSAGFAKLTEIRNETKYPLSFYTNDEDTVTIQANDSVNALSKEFAPAVNFVGWGQDAPIPGFGPSQTLTLQALASQGTAWLTQSLATPGNMTLIFQAQATDMGDIQVVLANSLATNPPLRITIGGWQNTKSTIGYNGLTIAQVLASENPMARAFPGRYIPYWVTLSGNLVLVGMGLPGSNVFMSAYVPNLPAFDRVGFSSFLDPISYTEVSFDQVYVPQQDSSVYWPQDPNNVISMPVAADVGPQEVPIKMRVASQGCISMVASINDGFGITFRNRRQQEAYTNKTRTTPPDEYKIMIGAGATVGSDGSTYAVLSKNGKEAIRVNISEIPQLQFDPKSPVRLWFSIDGGMICAGFGDSCKGTFLYWQDLPPMMGQEPQSLNNLDWIGVMAVGGPASLTRIMALPTVNLMPQKPAVDYSFQINRLSYSGAVQVIRPINYAIAQYGQRLQLKDMSSGKMYDIMGTPNPGEVYPIMFDFAPDGTPTPIQTEQGQKSAAQIQLEKTAALDQISAQEKKDEGQAQFQAAQSVSTPMSAIVAGVALVANQAFDAAGIGLDDAAASETADASRAQLEEQYGYRADTVPVYTEAVNRGAGGALSVTDEAQANRAAIDQLLSQLIGMDPSQPPMFFQMVTTYKEIFDKITSSYVIADASDKQRIFDDMQDLINNYESVAASNTTGTNGESAAAEFAALLCKAFSNQYIIDKSNQADLSVQDDWYRTMTSIGEVLFATSMQQPAYQLPLAALRGEYLWLPVELAQANTGSLVFGVTGTSDCWVCFAQEDYKVAAPPGYNNIYEFRINARDGAQHELAIKSLGKYAWRFTKDAATAFEQKHPNDLVMKDCFFYDRPADQPFWYWVDINMTPKGTCMLRMGQGKTVGKDIRIQWEDPYPWGQIRYIGMGSWQADLVLQGVTPAGVQPMSDVADANSADDSVVDADDND